MCDLLERQPGPRLTCQGWVTDCHLSPLQTILQRAVVQTLLNKTHSGMVVSQNVCTFVLSRHSAKVQLCHGCTCPPHLASPSCRPHILSKAVTKWGIYAEIYESQS